MRLRGVAAITALWLVVFGVLAMRHEADTAHVGDGAGGYAHAPALAGVHGGGASDIHGQRDAHADNGHCTLLTAFHQATRSTMFAAVIPATAQLLHAVVARSAPCAIVTARVYRLAPKTSPPRAA